MEQKDTKDTKGTAQLCRNQTFVLVLLVVSLGIDDKDENEKITAS